MFSSLSRISKAGRVALVVAAVLAVTALAPWLLSRLQIRTDGGPRTVSTEQSLLNLGFDYLPITPKLARANGLGITSGVLVTRVAPGSPADRAGLKVGDVVTSFDGVALDNGTSLLEMLIACPTIETLDFEVCGQGQTRAIRMVTAKVQ